MTAVRRLVGIALAACLAACATEAKFRDNMESWKGAAEGYLIASWGPPDSVYETGDTRYLTYLHQGSYTLPGTAPTYYTTYGSYSATSIPIGGTPPQTVATSCKMTFVLKNERVIDWQAQGNSCVSD